MCENIRRLDPPEAGAHGFHPPLFFGCCMVPFYQRKRWWVFHAFPICAISFDLNVTGRSAFFFGCTCPRGHWRLDLAEFMESLEQVWIATDQVANRTSSLFSGAAKKEAPTPSRSPNWKEKKTCPNRRRSPFWEKRIRWFWSFVWLRMWWSLASFESNSWVLPHFYLTSIFNFDEFGDGQRELAHSLPKKQQPPPTKQNHDLQICIGFALQRHFLILFSQSSYAAGKASPQTTRGFMKSQEGPHRKWRRSVTENERNEAPWDGHPGGAVPTWNLWVCPLCWGLQPSKTRPFPIKTGVIWVI